MKNIIVRVKIVVEPDDDGFHAYCPDLPGLHVDGTSEENAVDNAKLAVQAYVASLVKHGHPIPLSVSAKIGIWDLLKSHLPTRSIERFEDLALAA